MIINPIKGTTAKRTLFIGSALLVGLMAMMSMPQMIGSANATIEGRGEQGQGAEHACKELPGATLERGQCVAPAESELVCEPSSVSGVTATLSGQTCKAGPKQLAANQVNDFKKACEGITVDGEQGVFKQENVPRSGDKIVTCTFPATEEFTCPNNIEPINGQCITKPGDRTEEVV